MQSPAYRVALLTMLLCMTLIAAGGCSTLAPAEPPKGADVSLLQLCQEPQGNAETNGALALWLRSALDSISACNEAITIFKESSK